MGLRTARHAVAYLAKTLIGAPAAAARTADPPASRPTTDLHDRDAGIDLFVKLRFALGWDSLFDRLYERVFAGSVEPGRTIKARAGDPPDF